jgi:tetratricopeptide (TPR) repeat protein
MFWRYGLALALLVGSRGVFAEPAAPGPRAIDPRAAIEPAAPVLPAEVVAAMQEGRFGPAQDALAKLAAETTKTSEKAYYGLIRGIAQRLAGQRDEARKTFNAALEADPRGVWTAKLRLELATVELAAGRFAAAEELARTEAVGLLADDRKDRLAEVYHAFARRLLEPDDPIVKADPNAAYELLVPARDLAKSEALRARLLFAMGRASQAGGNFPRAIENFQAYVREYPAGADRSAARYELGEAQQSAGNALAARLTWTDLARDLDVRPADAPRAPDGAPFRARALYRIASTYGIPQPPDDTSLNLGVAALRRFLGYAPDHRWAVKAAYEIGEAYLARGKSQEALDAFGAFLKEQGFRAESDDAKRDLAERLMTGAFQVGRILQGQEKFAEATAAWKGYLTRFPNGPQSADAQRAILDTQLLLAADHLRREQFAEARAAWQAFVAENPLDERVPMVLFAVGESFQTEKKYDLATAAWQPLLSKFPKSEPAAHAQFAIALIEETEKGDPGAAIERFRKIDVEPWHSQAQQRIAVMEAKALVVITPRTFRSGETPHLKITTRNLETLTFTVYTLSAEAYFRKKHALGNVESLDIGLVAPDAEWTVGVAGYAKYKPIEKDYDVKVKVPGVSVIKVTDEKSLQATTLVIGSDLDAIVKTSREQVLIFAQDMKTGRGRPGARVLISDGAAIVLDARTGADGVLLKTWEKPREAGAGLQYLVLDGSHVAGSGLGVPDKVAQGLTPRAYIATDRPAYRPGQVVALRGVVREVKDSQYANVPGADYRFEVADSRGRQIVARTVSLSAFGTFSERVPLDEGAPIGTYRVRLYQPGKSEFAGQFEVQSYQLQPIDLTFDLKKTVYYRGETIAADIVARYQYGAPAAGRPIAVGLPDGRTLQGTTDAEGKYHVELATEGFAEQQALRLVARLPQDNVAAAAIVLLAVHGFGIDVATTRDVYLDGESFALGVTTRDAQGTAIGQALSVSALKQVTQAGRTTEREVWRKPLATDAKTGQASIPVVIDDADGGHYVIRVAGTDRFGNPVVAARDLTISGKKDETKLRLLADRLAYKVGEEASVVLHSRGRPGTALVTWEADRILTYKLVRVEPGANPVAWAIDGAQFPNFTLAAVRMAESTFDEARLDLRVERDLRVTVTPAKPTVQPGEPFDVEITTVDQLGRPVSAEIALALVDRSLLRIYGDHLPPIGGFFYDQTRTGAFSTTATNTFTYAPGTTPVAEAVVEEDEKAVAQAANAVDRERLREEAKGHSLGRDITAHLVPPPGAAPAGAAGVTLPSGRYMYEMAGQDKSEAQSAVNGPAVQADAMGRLGSGGRGGSFSLGLTLQMPADEAKLGEALSRADFLDEIRVGAEDSRLNQRRPGMVAARAKLRKDLSAQPRQRFVETAYWNPSLVTDPQGKARVTLNAPMALSRYEFTARGVTGSDTLVGQTSAELVVKKDFFVDLKIPAGLTQGDKPRFQARLHHMGVTGAVVLRLAVYAGEREEVYPRTIEVKGDGVEEVLFEPFEVPDGDSVRLSLSAELGAAKDELVTEVPIRRWGVQATASAAGTASDNAVVTVGLPAGRTYESPEMLISIAPTLKRMLIELALGQNYAISRFHAVRNIFPPLPNTTADRASDLLAATSALTYLRTARVGAAPEAQRLTDRIRGLVAELIVVQNEDGGWPWVSGGGDPAQRKPRPSDRMTSARVAWALASAEPLGLLTDVKILDQATAHLSGEFAKLNAADRETRAALLHAISTHRGASFELVNSLNRQRQGLSDVALGYLALTLANLDRPELASEVLDVLGPRSKTEPAGPGRQPRRFWPGASTAPAHRGPAEATALAALAYARVRPQAPELAGAIDWLLAHRIGDGWQPHKAKGPALAALGAYYGKAAGAEDRYHLVVTVNDTEVLTLDVTGAAEGKSVLVPQRALKAGDANRVRFAIEGRGTFGYAVTLTGFTRDFGPDQARTNRSALIWRRDYLAAEPEHDGKTLPTGFSVAVNARGFENKVSQVATGGRARVVIDASRDDQANVPDWERDFLVVEEHLPAGATLIEGSVQSQAAAHDLTDGVLTFYFAPNQYPGRIQYDVYGYLPGAYRALPASIRSAYDPGRSHLGPVGEIRVLAPGERVTDPYTATPDELFARGKALFDAGRMALAAGPLEELFGGYTLRDDIAKDAARMLLLINIDQDQPRKVVQYFEVVKEKAPELVLTFDKLLAIGRAYRAIGEFERAYLVWRGVIEASYLEDARIGEVLRQRGRMLEGIAYLLDLWRAYPNSASIESDFFGLSQVLARHAGQAVQNPALRQELAGASVTRSALLLQSIRLIQVVLSQSPKNPLADEASLALVNAFLELEDFEAVVKLSGRFAKLYPKSTFLDSFQYSEALGDFHLAHYDRAVEVAETIAAATYQDASGALQPSPNKWQALYILGQIFDARRQPARALQYYEQVADRFSDAAGAIASLKRKDLSVAEITVVRAPGGPKVAEGGGGEGLRAVAPERAGATVKASHDARDKPEVVLDYRNIAEADVKVYPVDLMRLYLTRRNLDQVAGIDLAGITPLFETTVKLGDGSDYDDKARTIALPLTKEGAYLVMVRGEDLYASGIVLVTPLEMEVLEEPASGRVRVRVRDAETRESLAKVQVKVIGSENTGFLSGETDLRGVSVAEGVRGQVTAVARKGSAQYAFYRGTGYVGAAPTPPAPSSGASAAPALQQAAEAEALDKNLKDLNTSNQMRQIERLEQRYGGDRKKGAAAGGFK